MILDALRTQLTFGHLTFQRNLDGIDHAASMRAPDGGGNPINWILGHVLHARSALAGLIGIAPSMDPERLAPLYARGTDAFDADTDAVPLDELRAALDASQEALLAALRDADPAWLERDVPGLFGPGEETAGVQFAALVFHENYHAGQVGTLRRALGLGGAL